METTTATITPAAPVAPYFPTGMPVATFPAVGGQWPKSGGQYLDHTHPTCIAAAFAYYVATGAPVSKWAESVGFQHSGLVKREMNRVLRKAGHPSFTRQAAALYVNGTLGS